MIDREGLEKLAQDVAAHIYTDVLGKRGDYDGWMDDKSKVAELIRRALLAAAREEAKPESMVGG